MHKKIATLFFLIIFLYGIPSCERKLDCSIEGEYFNINGIIIYNVEGKARDYSNDRNVNPIENGETVQFEHFIIRTFFVADYYSDNQDFLDLDFSNKVYARDCPKENGYKGSKEKLDTLFLITNADYNEHFFAGDTINEIVEANAPFSYWEVKNFLPLPDYVSKAQEKIQYQWFQMKLIEEPTFKDLNHSFTLIVKLQNGELYSAQTDTVRFQ